MKRAALTVVLATSLPLAGCLQLDRGESSEVVDHIDMVASPALDGEVPRGSYVASP